MAILTTTQTYPNTAEGKIDASIELAEQLVKKFENISQSVLSIDTQKGDFTYSGFTFKFKTIISTKSVMEIFIYSGHATVGVLLGVKGVNASTEHGLSMTLNSSGYGSINYPIYFGNKYCVFSSPHNGHIANVLGVIVTNDLVPLVVHGTADSKSAVSNMNLGNTTNSSWVKNTTAPQPNSGYCILCNAVGDGEVLSDVCSYSSNPNVGHLNIAIFGGKKYFTLTNNLCIEM